MRVVSLVPSLTEFLFDINLGDELVGRTRFCIHPLKQLESVRIVGGTKNPNIDNIKALNPDLVICNKEENRHEDVLAIQTFAKVLVTEIHTISDAFRELKRIGKAVHRTSETKQLIEKIQLELPEQFYSPVETMYFIWKNPWMSVGNDTYINDVMKTFGLVNRCGDLTRYPELNAEKIQELNPELVLLSSEPFPFGEKHRLDVQMLLPNAKIELVNGEWFSWYGSGMKHAFSSLKKWRNEFDTNRT
ncbi:hypothetical protein EP331_13960 [bacterium]|nr:MAG: hypothetical protein EP331_13960 [bacterium]